MSSKNNFRKSVIFFIFIMTQHILFAQTFQYSSSYFNITLPSLSTPSPNPDHPPYYTLFIETGNGRYYKDGTHISSASASSPYQIFYDKVIPHGSNAILNIVGHYDTIKPPRELYTFPPDSHSATDASPQITLDPGKKIGFAYADKTVVLGDTMTYVVTYKPDSVVNTIVAFFYNDNNSFNRQRVFTEITDPGQLYPFVFADGNTTRIYNRNAIRVNDGATPIYTTSPDGIPSGVSTALANAMNGFNNAIYFKMFPGQNANENERNAFISMIAPLNSDLIGSFANIKAVLIKYSNVSGYISQDTVRDIIPVDRFASDPNGIRTTPHCLSGSLEGSSKGSVGTLFNRPINYDVTFRNDGDGDAKHVEVTVLVPEGIQLSSSQILNVKSTVSRKSIVFSKKPVFGRIPLNTYEIISNGTDRKIVFTMTDIKLPGVATSEASKKDFLLRQGAISFTLNTIADPHDSHIASDKLSCMYSDVSIVFTSFVRGRESTSTITGWDLVRGKCNIASPLPPPCPRKAKPFVRPLPESVQKALKRIGT